MHLHNSLEMSVDGMTKPSASHIGIPATDEVDEVYVDMYFKEEIRRYESRKGGRGKKKLVLGNNNSGVSATVGIRGDARTRKFSPDDKGKGKMVVEESSLSQSSSDDEMVLEPVVSEEIQSISRAVNAPVEPLWRQAARERNARQKEVLQKIKHLEVLSMSGIQSICDKFVNELIPVHGSNLRELAFAGCLYKTQSLMPIQFTPHPHAGNKWCIYPSYDYAHCMVDSLENITHSVISAGLRRRGVSSTATNSFIRGIGITRSDNSLVRVDRLEYRIREELNKTASRTMAVLRPLKVLITNLEDGQVTDLEGKMWPDAPADDTSSYYKATLMFSI